MKKAHYLVDRLANCKIKNLRERMGTKFAEWLLERYGSEAAGS